MARKKPNIDLGNITKRRDRESFKNFILEVFKGFTISTFGNIT